MRNLEKENIYFVTGYLLGYHIGAGQDEMECEDRESFKEGYDAGCVDAVEEEEPQDEDLSCPNCGNVNTERHDLALSCSQCGWEKMNYFDEE